MVGEWAVVNHGHGVVIRMGKRILGEKQNSNTASYFICASLMKMFHVEHFCSAWGDGAQD